MANNDLLAQFSPSDVSHFRKDFIELVKVGAEIDRYYGEAQHDLDTLIPKYEKLVEKFNKKYKGIKIKPKRTIEHYKVRLFVNSKDVKEFFSESASKIPGLKSAGKAGHSQADIADIEKFARLLDSLLDKIYLSYSDPESGTSTIAAIYSMKEKMMEILYAPADVMNENSAGFRICAFYALKEGFDRKIEVYGDASTFGFSNLLDEMERREWYDKFNPRFLE